MRTILKSIVTLGLALCVVVDARAETGIGFPTDPGMTNPLKPAAEGLKDLFATDRFDMRHTVGFNFGTGASRFSQYYLNTMTYKVSEPLTIQATLGVQNQTLGSGSQGRGSFGGGAGGARIIVPNIGILYRPTPNLRIEFGFSNTPYGGGNPYYGSGYDPFRGRRGY